MAGEDRAATSHLAAVPEPAPTPALAAPGTMPPVSAKTGVTTGVTTGAPTGVPTGVTIGAPTGGPPGAANRAPIQAPGRASLPREKAAAMDAILDQVGRAPEAFDFYQVLRRLESLYCDRAERPRFGAASRPADEPVRLGQEPSLEFAPRALSGVSPGKNGAPPRLAINFFGLIGPNGPLPLHLTEYARERQRHADDPTMIRFFDLFHHRMMLLFYRAWSTAQPTVGHDHPATNRFLTYVGALEGLGMPGLRNRDAFPDSAKLFYAGRLGGQTRNADGLGAMIGEFFRMPAQIESFVGSWLAIPAPHQWRLGLGRLARRRAGRLDDRGPKRLEPATEVPRRARPAQPRAVSAHAARAGAA